MTDRKRTILVSGASGIVGYGVLKSLRELKNLSLIGTTIYDDSIAPAFCDIFEIALRTDDEKYFDWLEKIIKKYNIDMVIPGIELDMSLWNKNRKFFEKLNVFPLLNNYDLIELCLDKWNFYQKLKEHDCPYAIDTTLEPDFGRFKTPFLLKPRCGFGSKGLVKVEDKETFNLYKDKIGNTLMLQPIVGSNDEEYTASAFFDKQSNMKAFMTLKRKLSKDGFTEKAEVVFPAGIKDAIENIASIFKPVGPTNFQFRKENGEWKLLEINPRISSSSSIRKAFGYNESKMSVEYFLFDKEIIQPEIRHGKAIRYTEDYIFYDSHNI